MTDDAFQNLQARKDDLLRKNHWLEYASNSQVNEF